MLFMYCIFRNSSPVKVQVFGTKNLVLIWPGTGIPHVLRAPHKAMYMHACESEYNCVVTLLHVQSY